MNWIEIMFYTCFTIGIIYTLISLFIGDVDFDIPIVEPFVLVSGLTAYGGLGIVLYYFTNLSNLVVITLSAGIAIIISILGHFFWVKPMKNAERTTTFSASDLEGLVGEVFTTIPPEGVGEVVIIKANGRSNYVSESYGKTEIQQGSKVLVIEVTGGVLRVVKYDQLFEKLN